ncbi:hypothetical protein ACO0R3_001686 [Hanseniaspora guilliermondii]
MEDKNLNSNDESFFENIKLEYPAWFNDLNKELDYSSDEDFYYNDNHTGNSPVSFEDIYTIFEELQRKFGFQCDNMKNMYIHLLTQLDSRASRMSAKMALITLHADYIGGDHANYRKWYFSCQLDLDEEVGFNNLKLHGKSLQRNKSRAKKNKQKLKTYWEVLDNQQKSRNEINSTEFKNINFFPRKRSANPDFLDKDIITLDKSITTNILKSSNESLSKDINQQITNESNKKESFKNIEHKRKKYWKKKGKSLKYCSYLWKQKMNNLSYTNMIRQIALYLLCWGEANNIRFTPECLCFIFKCCLDYDQYTSTLEITSLNEQEKLLYQNKHEFYYLDEIITPIYNFLQQSVYDVDKNGNLQRKPKDHKDVIGYDDVNQLFWYPEGIEMIILNDGSRLIDKPFNQRFLFLNQCNWKKVFYKTYYEKRSWFHCLTNFNRFWIVHLTSFWYFTSLNAPTFYTANYHQLLDNPPTIQATLAVMSLSGTLACIIQILATIFEFSYVPRKWPGAQYLSKRLIGLIVLLLINFCPSMFVLTKFKLNEVNNFAQVIAIVQLFVSLITCVFFSVRPLGGMFSSYLSKGKYKRRYVSSKTFTASFPTLSGRSRWFSHGLWISVFTCKFIESYFFLTLSLKDPLRVLSILNMSRCNGDSILPKVVVCNIQPKITIVLLLLTDLILFFLDTYLWYIICNCFFSIALSFSLGTSILTPWKNIYVRLPSRIYSKIIATNQMSEIYKTKWLVSQVWNALIISFFREHLLTIEHTKKMLYTGKEDCLKAPTFFIAEDDSTFKSTEYFVKDSEAQRRISFFAQSLSTPITEPLPVECMQTFTVIIPHYSEKIMMSLPELIKQKDFDTKLTLLEYLQQLYKEEWKCFVKDTKVLANELGYLQNNKSSASDLNSQEGKEEIIQDSRSSLSNNSEENKNFDLAFETVGFNTSNPIFTTRTRIWASLRTQTLYRTISGFQNYIRALKILYRVENPLMIEVFGEDKDGLELELESMANKKFKMVVAMQRYAKFNKDELADTNFLLKAYPYMTISYLDEEIVDDPKNDKVVKNYYSCAIDGFSKIDENTHKRIPNYRIKLSGNPILGDGKSDNQNHSIIFYRGEYIQVVDANQDNYIEECLKIRSVLNEFEEVDIDSINPYKVDNDYMKDESILSSQKHSPVAIIGAREYIFSENIGILGDIAAGKEQTFGTLFARTLAEIGGKLHYGHPDFLNAIFMTTRGGISKAQKGLHLNEDIYAGITATCRGGRIKHSDYFQCGKGRDLGFGSILNFTTKIGAGMGEQSLSREYYYLGTQMPIDRFLSFFYAHPGFHLNNLFISLSVQLFFLLLLNVGSMNHELISCLYNKDVPITDIQSPLGCYNLQPVLNWVTIFVLSIFIVFFIAFCPLLIQEVLERGIWKAFARFLHHLISFSPLFEVFVCQIYSNSLISDITFGSAKYLATGRGFAITRISFSELYFKFTTSSIYTGSKIFLMLTFAISTMWQPALLWFTITLMSLTIAPFFFNPHQFMIGEFFYDYMTVLKYFINGNSHFERNSWANYTKLQRVRYTGLDKKRLNDESEKQSIDINIIGTRNLLLSEIIVPFVVCIFTISAYLFINGQTGVKDATPTSSALRLIIVTFLPLILNCITVGMFAGVSMILGPIAHVFSNKRAISVIGALTHFCGCFYYLLDFELIFVLEGLNFSRSILLLLAVINIQQLLLRVITVFFLTKEFKSSQASFSWWSAIWIKQGLGWNILTAPFREYICKCMENTYFAADFFLTHALLYCLAPLCFIPFVDSFHSMILFWLKPNELSLRKVYYGSKEKKKRRGQSLRGVFMFAIIFILISAFLAIPLGLKYMNLVETLIEPNVDNLPFVGKLVQPINQNNNDTGPAAPSTILKATPDYEGFATVAFW